MPLGGPDRVHDEKPGFAARIVRALLVGLYRRGGWTSVGTVPAIQRFVLIAVPHTSNWDFPNFLGVTQALGIRTHFMAKASLFRWPLGGFMRQVGGVRLDRATAKDTVQQMVDEFARREDFVLTIAPEGTRGAVGKWRTGFLPDRAGRGRTHRLRLHGLSDADLRAGAGDRTDRRLRRRHGPGSGLLPRHNRQASGTAQSPLTRTGGNVPACPVVVVPNA